MADPTLEKNPTAGTSVNKPESGTYGEGAAESQLRSDLPPMDRVGMGAATGGPSPMPQPSPQLPGSPGGRPVNAPGGVPPAILAPGDAPAPANTPNAPMSSPQATRLALLEQLAVSPEVSDQTREWAQMVLEALRA